MLYSGTNPINQSSMNTTQSNASAPAKVAHTPKGPDLASWAIEIESGAICRNGRAVGNGITRHTAVDSMADALIEQANHALDLSEKHARLTAQNAALVKALVDATRYIEVKTAYTGAMTADEVEAAIKAEYFPAIVAIGANSCNTLARFNISEARELLAQSRTP